MTWIAGGYQSDFARNLTREGVEVSELTAEVVAGTLTAAGIEATAIGVIHVGNAFGQLFTGQGQLGSMPATVEPALWEVPASRHEGACASGSLAVLAAMADLESGRYDVALVLGVELEKTVPPAVGAGYLGAAAWVGHEAQGTSLVWPLMFSELAEEYDRRYGLDAEYLSAIAELNLGNARANPNAQTRGWTVDPRYFTADDVANPVVAGRLRRSDCAPMTDGGAGVVLVSDRYRREHAGRADRPMARILGWGHRTVGLALQPKLDRSSGDPYVLPHVRRTILDAFDRARIASVDHLDLIETHDCFSISEYLAIDHFGITAPGDAWKAIGSGELAIGGRMPVNPSGGLLGGGHPVGATGIRMLLDAYRQVTGRAGGYQVPGARTAGTLNLGGSTATTVSFVVGADQS